MKYLESLKKYLPKEKDIKPAIILLSATMIFTLWKYQGSPDFFDKTFAPMFSDTANIAFLRIAYYGIASLLFLFLVPLLIVKFGFKEKLYDYGLNFRDFKFGIKVIVFAYPLILLSMISVAHDPEYQLLNPMYSGAGDSGSAFILYAVIYGMYYIGWEFFFRGFILFGIRDRFGDIFAVLIQTLPSVVAHIGRPESEMISSIIAGVVFGFLILRSKSIWYVVILHWFIGLGCDILCILAVKGII